MYSFPGTDSINHGSHNLCHFHLQLLLVLLNPAKSAPHHTLSNDQTREEVRLTASSSCSRSVSRRQISSASFRNPSILPLRSSSLSISPHLPPPQLPSPLVAVPARPLQTLSTSFQTTFSLSTHSSTSLCNTLTSLIVSTSLTCTLAMCLAIVVRGMSSV